MLGSDWFSFPGLATDSDWSPGGGVRLRDFLGGSVGKNPPAKQEIRVHSLGREDPLEKGMATHSRMLAWKIPWTEEPGGLQSMGLQRVGHNLGIKEQQQICCEKQ